ncbi:2,3-bisphosphoglycerate-independent phosphoglycerate mutase [Halobacteroides halobius DSM 5150]|uniref:2,3-bisphosphoglycerate-independent phosphoglycerate mutase n=1 Tax=Halobacteroides halobius (strain ATCC 35273 / DSM 5150 / MD-1) TaxID=748449 RepID=L0KAF1_HALHC|nr:2,3-bisphosphoglycerate-independent phosphoglycerate mutase [Halobacteroides halobius]AGB41991.1 2,3-bisphosphoglycerate-independent phosphoglycerate mutase [Halobacteroides halobius DSM 5150]
MAAPKPLALIILDGFGCNSNEKMNGVKAANTPNFDKLSNEYPSTTVEASGKAVGLPDGQMGNSEVGHMNLGAGRVVYQDFTRINMAVRNNELVDNEAIAKAIEKVKNQGTALHLVGLLSDGGVHSHINHLFGLLEMAERVGIEDVYVHAILDGRDTPPQSAKKYVEQLEDKMKELGVGQIATIGGRYYYMDRDNNWERTEKAYNAMCLAEGNRAKSALEAIEASYQEDVTDEFVIPTVITDNSEVAEDDSIIFFNFRADRARQLTRALNDTDFNGFDRSSYSNAHLVCMTEYDETIDAPVAFPPVELENIFSQVLADNDLKQLRTAETEKYAHVTFFFNGGKEEAFKGEDRELISSPDVATYDQKPEMSAYEVTDNLVEKIAEQDYDVVVLNYANPDMVGHTGDFDAEVEALEVVDECLGKTVDAILEQGGSALITADHGNGEQMVDYETGEPFTAHTTNPVPFIYVNPKHKDAKLIKDGKLADFAPTMLNLLGLEVPEEMTGQQLIVENN